MALKLVPFSEAWITHDKIDVHAIYRRPRFVEDEYGEWQPQYDADGLQVWDLTGPLPVRKHNAWRQKGFEYVTLANRDSLIIAAKAGTIENWRQYDQHQTGGPWNYRKYIEGANSGRTAELDSLRANVEKFGWEAAEAIKQQTDPHFKMPDALKAPKKAATKGAAA